MEQGTEVVFWGADSAALTIRDDSGIVSGGQTGTVEPDTGGGLDLTITEQFARSMSLQRSAHPDNLLCYEMNGEPLPPEHGFPVRLIAPGWYGVANVKWLTRIEVLDHRYAGQFMARDYVTIREEQRDGETVWTFTTVSHDRLKSAPAKVTRQNARYTIMGAAWGAPIAAVEVQIDDGPWLRRSSDSPAATKIAWLRVEVLDIRLGDTDPGRAHITSRAFDLMAISSQRRTIPSSPAEGPSGRAMGRSPVEFLFSTDAATFWYEAGRLCFLQNSTSPKENRVILKNSKIQNFSTDRVILSFHITRGAVTRLGLDGCSLAKFSRTSCLEVRIVF